MTSNEKRKKTELLAPAGNTECAFTAIDGGADALYLGCRAFSARAGADNFSSEELRKVITRAHAFGVKVYAAMNTLVKQTETEEFIRTLIGVWNAGADAIILQDVLLGKYIHTVYPEIVLHLSTQAGVCNVDGALFAKRCGFSRVILARETPFTEIVKISAVTETETFVQGALCTCFSGQCYFSSFVGGNSGNRGRCKQPCRKLYSFDRSGFEDEAYALSLSDLCVGERINRLIGAGVSSFKIEGRMRRAEYVGTAVRYYRALLDGENEAEKSAALTALKRAYNRGNYTGGLAFGQDKRLLSRAVQGHIGEKVGTVKVVDRKYFVESFSAQNEGDYFKILRGGKEIGGATFVGAAKRGFYISSRARLHGGDGVFVTTDTKLAREMLSRKRRIPVEVCVGFRAGEKMTIRCRERKEKGREIFSASEKILPPAISSPLTEKEVESCFLKTDALPFDVSFRTVDCAENAFFAKSELNALRRKTYTDFYAKLSDSDNVLYDFQPIPAFFGCVSRKSGRHDLKAVIASDFPLTTGNEADIFIWKPNDYRTVPPEFLRKGACEKYVYMPPFTTETDGKRIAEIVKTYAFSGVYAENYGSLLTAEREGFAVFAATGFNLFNEADISYLDENSCVKHYALSKELNEKERKALCGEKAFVLAGGGIKLMDLCYCPFQKTCFSCDKREFYTLTDEAGRRFPVRRYTAADGDCRFEVYNCALLSDGGEEGAGKLFDFTLPPFAVTEKTSGHRKKGVL